MQPRHLKVIAQVDEGARLLTEVCRRVLNGDVPEAVQAYLYSRKILVFSKLSKRQADLEARVDVALAGEEAERDMKLSPIAVGEALLRLAERAFCSQKKQVFVKHLLEPTAFQTGVAIAGGLSMWPNSTCVEAML
jgi:hypothetical protein